MVSAVDHESRGADIQAEPELRRASFLPTRRFLWSKAAEALATLLVLVQPGAQPLRVQLDISGEDVA